MSERRKKIAIIGSVGIPANYGGFETLAEKLSLELKDRFDITVFCSSKSYEERLPEYKGIRLEYIPLKANGAQSVPYDMWSIWRAAKHHDTLLILGTGGSLVLPICKRLYKRNYLVHVDGIEWKRGKWGKITRSYIHFAEKFGVKRGDCVISDNQAIKNTLLDSYGIDSVMIPYGADHVSAQPLSDEVRNSHPILQKQYAFSVCRIEPENNIHVLLGAFSKIQKMPFVLIGNWHNSAYGLDLRERYGAHENLLLLDPIYDQQLLDQYRSNCSLYLHGHSAGGTNPSLVEAMYLGLNVLAFDVSFNRFTTEEKASYFTTAKDLQEKVDQSIIENGKVMQAIALERYTWKKIAEAYTEIF